MGLFTSINIAATGLSVERTRLDVISNNIANASTTRTPEGGAFKRSQVILRPRDEGPYWRSPFLPNGMDKGIGTGVRIHEIHRDTDTEPRYNYDPTHPDAILTGRWEGYVELPNVDIVTEMVDMIGASRAYEANAAVIDGTKSMFQKALEIGTR